ncbi:MAG: prepilin-type N-terminal cleavage/methylation domain-containing protein [Opitutaceae bacterium]
MKKTTNSVAGFTLVELLAVILIVGILGALIMFVLGGVQEAGRSARCSSNLRQVFMGMQAFASENKGQIIRWIDQDKRALTPDQKYDTYWFAKLSDTGYVPTPSQSEVWKCPNSEGVLKPGEIEQYDLVGEWKTMSYAINAVHPNASKDHLSGPSLVLTATPPYERNRVQNLPSPATTIALCDGKSWLILDNSGATKATAAGVHKGGMNAVFWDGHVEHFTSVLPNNHRYFSISAD